MGSRLIDTLVGPHGIDRYLELLHPTLTINDARALVTRVTHQTNRSVTLTVKPNPAFGHFRAGQFVKVGVEIDGVRRTRTFSPASTEHNRDELELTLTVRDGGTVSSHLKAHARPGMLLHLGAAGGDFTLPDRRPPRVVLISGGSGVTPTLAMLRTLLDEDHSGRIHFVHFARTRADQLYGAELAKLSAAHPNLTVDYVATREDGRRFDHATIPAELAAGFVAVCGPPPLIEAVREHHPHAVSETFTPPTLAVTGAQAAGTLRFTKSDATAEIGAGTLLEQAERAGLTPEHGCRMGICHTCTCRKTAGAVKNLLTGAVTDEEDEDIQLCVSVPVGDVALEI